MGGGQAQLVGGKNYLHAPGHPPWLLLSRGILLKSRGLRAVYQLPDERCVKSGIPPLDPPSAFHGFEIVSG